MAQTDVKPIDHICPHMNTNSDNFDFGKLPPHTISVLKHTLSPKSYIRITFRRKRAEYFDANGIEWTLKESHFTTCNNISNCNVIYCPFVKRKTNIITRNDHRRIRSVSGISRAIPNSIYVLWLLLIGEKKTIRSLLRANQN